MKVALCIHGYFNSNYDRTSLGENGYRYIKKTIINRFNPDIYIHSWDQQNKNQINRLYNPVQSIFEDQIDFSEQIKKNGLSKLENQPRPPQTVFSHLYSVSKVISLCLDSNINYDLIIKARFDLGQINRLNTSPLISLYSYLRGNGRIYPVQCIAFPEKILNHKLYLAFWEKFDEGPADMWFYGSREIMKPFAKLFEKLKKDFTVTSGYYKFCYEKSNCPLILSNAIYYYKYFMIQNGLWTKLTPLKSKWN